jgi:uncharacterized protein YdaU (DUF1376 family)
MPESKGRQDKHSGEVSKRQLINLRGNSMTSNTDKHYWWIKLNIAKHIAATAMLTHEQKGIYQDLMMATAIGTPLPSDPALLASALGTTPKKLTGMMFFAADQFATVDDQIYHIEAMAERTAAIKRSDDGRMFAQKRWAKTKNTGVVTPIGGGEK